LKQLVLLLFCLLVVPLALASGDVKVVALFTGKALLQVDGEQKIVSNGETFRGVLLQSATGRGAVVVIDGETLKLGMNQSIAGNFKKPDLGTIRIAPDARGMYFTRGSINGHATSFLVDTGATHVTLSGNKARSLGIDYKEGMPGSAQTAAAIVPVWQIRLDSVSIGNIELANVTATVISGKQPADVLLGNSFLRRTDMQQAGSVLTIKRRF
jgi:aspartyl protease family protein